MSRRYLLSGAIAGIVVVFDLLTKRFAAQNFADKPVVVISDLLSFTYHENPGAAFSFFRSSGQFVGLLVIGIVIVLIAVLRKERPLMEVVAFGLLLGGALGNLADRIFRSDSWLDGSVIDWIDFWFIPTFNIADLAVNVAVLLLLIEAWRQRAVS